MPIQIWNGDIVLPGSEIILLFFRNWMESETVMSLNTDSFKLYSFETIACSKSSVLVERGCGIEIVPLNVVSARNLPSIFSGHAPTHFQLMVNLILFTPFTTWNADKEPAEDGMEKRRKEVIYSSSEGDSVVKFSFSGFRKWHLCTNKAYS